MDRFQPYRYSQFESLDNWLKAGFTKSAAEAYLNGMKEALGNPNFVSDLRIPGAAQYTSVILDTEVARFLAMRFLPNKQWLILKSSGKKSLKISAEIVK